MTSVQLRISLYKIDTILVINTTTTTSKSSRFGDNWKKTNCRMWFLRLIMINIYSFKESFELFFFIVVYCFNISHFHYTGCTIQKILVTPSFFERSKWQDAVVQGTAVQGFSRLVCLQSLVPNALGPTGNHLKKTN